MIDAIVVKIRDGQVAVRPIYVAIGVNMHGDRAALSRGSRMAARGAVGAARLAAI